MPVQIAELYAKIGANDAEFQEAMSRVEGSVQRAGGLFERFSGFLGGAMQFAVGGLIARALEPLTSSFADLAGSVVGMNASLEKTVLQFQTLMGSADKARAHVEGLFKFAAETPFETQPIIEASKFLQIFGGSALNTHDTLILLGDAAAATSNRINDVAFWVGRAYSAMMAGRPFGEAAMRLQEMGILSAEARSRLEALMEKGAKGPEIWKAFTEELRRFSGAMKLQAGTWEGLTSTIADNVKMFIAKAGRPLFDTLKQILEALTALVTSPQFEALADTISNVLGGAIRFLADAISRAWVAAAPFFDWLGRIAGAVGEALQEGFGDAADALAEFLADFAPDWLVEGIRKVGAALDELIRAARLFVKMLPEGLGDAFDALGEALADFAPAPIVEAIYQLGGALEGLFGSMSGLAEAAPAALSAFAASVQGTLSALAGAIAPQAQALAETVTGILGGVWKTVADFWAQHGEQIVADVRTILGGILSAVQAVAPVILTVLMFAFQTLLAVVQAIWPAIQQIIASVLNVIAALIHLFASMIRGDWEGVMSALQSIAENIWNIILSIFQGALAALRAIVGQIIGLFRGVDWAGIGRGIIEGIRDGILSVAQSIADAAAAVVRNAIESAKRALRIRSPSRVAAEEIGEPLGLGVVEGFRKALASLPVPLPEIPGAMAAPAAGAGMAGGVTVVVHVHGSVMSDEDLAVAVARSLARLRQRGVAV
jgi:phage-related protein